MRCFIAVDIDGELTNKIVQLQNKLGELDLDVKLVEPENLHFTIKFLGNVNEDEVDVIKNSLENCLKGVKEFVINVNGIGYFGKPSCIRTLWLGLNKGEDKLLGLMKDVNDHVKVGDSRYSPHLTIGRVKSGRNKESILDFVNEVKNVNIGEMRVNEVKLKVSELGIKGPKYTDLAVFKLGS